MSGRPIAWLLLAVCLLTACGGGGGDTSGGSGNNGGTQPPSGIGSAGGTVNGPNGAKIVVPAGALAQNVNIAVAQSSTGRPRCLRVLPPSAICSRSRRTVRSSRRR